MRLLWGILLIIYSTFLLNSFESINENIGDDDIPKKAISFFKKAKEKIIYEDYEEGKKWLKKAIKSYPKYIAAYAELAKLHTKLKDYEAAKKAYEKILKIEPTEVNQFRVNYKIGQLMYTKSDYDAAIQYFKDATKVKSIPKGLQKAKDNAIWLLKNAQFAKVAIKNPVPFQPMRLDSTVNSPHDEYLPMLTADQEMLVFTRRFTAGKNGGNEDFYTSKKNTTDTIWRFATGFKDINTAKNEGAICVSPDGSRLFFAAKDRGGEGSFDIYYCMKVGDEWSRPIEIGPPVNTRGWESQPSISADGKKLYFASRRDGGFGGIDIWVSHLKHNFWTNPVNLGPGVNTAGDEQSPFIHPDGKTLYFSSNGHIGMGDADLFVTRKNDKDQWKKAENLGYPINTTGNENGMVVTANGEDAYFSSFTEEQGLDLYHFKVPSKAKPTYVTYVKGIVYDESDEYKKLEATIELIDLESEKTVLKTTSDKVNGSFLVTLPVGRNYMYNVSKKGYLFYSENFSLEAEDADLRKPYLINIPLSPIIAPPKPTEPPVDILVQNQPKKEVKKPTPKPIVTKPKIAKVETKPPKPAPPKVVEEKAKKEEDLLVLRDEIKEVKEEKVEEVVVKNELPKVEEKTPIEPPKVVETKPIPLPPPPPIEEKVVTITVPLPPPPIKKEVAAVVPKPAPVMEEKIVEVPVKVPEPAPKPAPKVETKPVVVAPPPPPKKVIVEPVIVPEPVIVQRPKPVPPPIVTKPKPAPRRPDSQWNVGKSVVLKNVFFETNSFELKSVSYLELNKLVELLKDYPNLQIEIGGHTDDVGKADYNLTLSENRAKSVYDFLVTSGISSRQLTYKGYGESRPIADNKTKEGRSKNRRTEFMVLDKNGNNTSNIIQINPLMNSAVPVGN